MRKYPLILTACFVALPAYAQTEPATPPPAAGTQPEKVELKEQPEAAKPGAGASTPTQSVPTATVAPMTGSGSASAAASSASRMAPATNSGSVSGPEVAGSDDWKFEYHGYFRAPMRVGIGKRDNPAAGQSKTTYHYPLLPDDQYLSWQHTNHNTKDWAEMFFSYGNSWAKGTLAIEGFNFTEAAWSVDSKAQFGIAQGYVTLTPDLGYENVRLIANVGTAWGKYGTAGKYDAGEFDTYLFGRTHVAGETVRVDIDIDPENTLWLEQGLGGKRPDPSQYNNARFTLLHHEHIGFKHGSGMEFTGAFMSSWAQEEDRIMTPQNPATMGGTPSPYSVPNYPSSLQGAPDGSLWVAGLDGRFDLGAFGYFYAGFSHIKAKNAITVAPAIEVLHSFGGGQFQLGVTDNYLGPSCVGGVTSGPLTTASSPVYGPGGTYAQGGCSMGNGSINSLLAQYEFSLTNLTQQMGGGQKFWGEGEDLIVKLYGMYNKVSDSDFAPNKGVSKLKYGTDVQYQLLPWLTPAVRFDRVQPNNKIPEQSFAIVSPRLVFKSKWVTHEQVSFQYSHYFYNQRTCAVGNPATNTSVSPYNPGQLLCVQPPPAAASLDAFGSNFENGDPLLRYAPGSRPDENVFKIEASMWW
jgi:hypothetical protein